MASDSVHVLVGAHSWVVTRVAPQFNSHHDSFEAAMNDAEELARHDHASLLIHSPDGHIESRTDHSEQ